MSDDTTTPEETSPAEEVMLKEIAVKLSDGETYYTRPWGIKTGRRMAGRLKAVWLLFQAAQGGNKSLGELLEASYDELVHVAADSIGVSYKKLNTDDYLIEDLLLVLNAVARINFVERPALGKVTSELLITIEKMAMTEEMPSMPDTEDSPQPLNT
jgi:hypothetical protein